MHRLKPPLPSGSVTVLIWSYALAGGNRWRRTGRHERRGRMTVDDVVALMAWHDDNHLEQIARALEGKA